MKQVFVWISQEAQGPEHIMNVTFSASCTSGSPPHVSGHVTSVDLVTRLCHPFFDVECKFSLWISDNEWSLMRP